MKVVATAPRRQEEVTRHLPKLRDRAPARAARSRRSATISGMPPWVVLTTGTPMACASANTMPKPSLSPLAAVTLGTQKTRAVLNASRIDDRGLNAAKLAADVQFSCQCFER